MKTATLLTAALFGVVCGEDEAGYNPEEHGDLLEGDIAASKRKNALVEGRWPDGEVPYVISGRYSRRELETLGDVFEAYRRHTCIRFRPKIDADRDYIDVRDNDKGCWSFVGRQGGRQTVHLERGVCFAKPGTVAHELMHSLGFTHEQNRKDRDEHVKIDWNNISPGHKVNFEKPQEPTTTFGISYDYNSIMHYSKYAFTNNSRPTILPMTTDSSKLSMGQRKGFTRNDLAKLNLMYECPRKVETNDTYFVFGEGQPDDISSPTTGNPIQDIINSIFG